MTLEVPGEERTSESDARPDYRRSLSQRSLAASMEIMQLATTRKTPGVTQLVLLYPGLSMTADSPREIKEIE